MPATGLLDDVTVIDVTGGYHAYTGKLLSDFGATVISVEPPGGDPAREIPPHTTAESHPNSSAFFSFLNTGKRSLVVEPADATTVRDCCADADILVTDGLEDRAVSVDTLRDRFPELIVVSIDTYGRDGPHADWESVPLTEVAMGGLMSLTGFPDRAPTAPGRSSATYLGCLYGAVGALLALRTRERTGRGQVVDVSGQEAIAAHLESENTDYAYNGAVSSRAGNRHALGHPIGEIYPTANGHVCVCLFGTFVEGPLGGDDVSMWEPFCELLDREDLLEDERFNALPEDDVGGFAKRETHAEELDEILTTAFADVDGEAFYREAQEAGLSVSLVTTPPDVFDDPQLAARDFLADVELGTGDAVMMPGSPFRFSDADVGPDPAPALDEYANEGAVDDGGVVGHEPDPGSGGAEDVPDSMSERPLEGLRVLDFTQVWAGPCGTKILADAGADVIKVESTGRPDVIRTTGPLFENDAGDPEYGEDRSGYFQSENRGKRSLAVDLKTDEGVQLIEDLVASGEIDVVTESFAPGTMERLGIDYDTLSDLDDSLIMSSVSGYGQEGPESGFRAYGAMLGAHAGIASMTGFPDDRPVSTGVAFVDPVTGISEAYAILAALRHRDRGGGGQYVDLSMREAGLMLAHQPITTYDVTGEELDSRGNRDERDRYVQGSYPTGDDLGEDEEGWITVAVRDEADWQALKGLLDHPKWTTLDAFADQAARRRNQDRLDEHLAAWTTDQERYELVERLQAAGIPAGVVQSTRDILENDPHLDDRGFWVDVSHHVIGDQPYPGALPRLDATPGRIDGPAPMLGDHSRKVLYEVLDVSGTEIRSLEDAGALQ